MTDIEKMTRRQVASHLGEAAGMTIAVPGFAKAALQTPEQVAGPFHPIVPQNDKDLDLTMVAGRSETAIGEPILVRGNVLDSNGNSLENALVDIWQANYFGRYTHPDDKNDAPLDPNFQGWAVIKTDSDGRYGFKTIMPGAYPLVYLGEEGWRCRHIHFKVSHPNAQALTTQMYFHGDPWIDQDIEIAKAEKGRRDALIAKPGKDGQSGMPLYLFEIVLASSSA